jgi:two-component system, chemotaxis family, sensor kinase CheA
MIDTEILQDYSSEARELLDEMENSLIRLEKEGATPELLNNIFRAVHCIKGSAEYIGLERSSTLTHGVENLLDRMREGVLQLDAGILDFLFRSKDLILTLIAEVSKDHEEKTTISAMMTELEGFLQGAPRPAPSGDIRVEPPCPQISEPELEAPAEPHEEEIPLVAAAAEEEEKAPEAVEAEIHDEYAAETTAVYEPAHVEARVDETLEPEAVAGEEVSAAEMEGPPTERIEETPEMVAQREAAEQLAEALETLDVNRTLEDTVPLLLNISLYLDDLQDGLRPGDVTSSLLDTVGTLIDSMRLMGLSEAVSTLERLVQQVRAIEPERDTLSQSEIDALREIVYGLRSVYPEDLFLPLKKSLARAEERMPEPSVPPTPAMALRPTAFALELQNVPGISPEAADAIEQAGFSSMNQILETDRAALQSIPSVTTEMAESMLAYLGAYVSPLKPAPKGPKAKDSLLADVDDELLREFEGMYWGEGELAPGAASNRFYPYGQKAADLLSELDAIGEDADREIMEIFLSYGWEILDKLRPCMDRMKSNAVSPADLGTCAELIKSIRSSSTYMDYQNLASFLDEWYERTLWSAQSAESLSTEDRAFMEQSLARFQDFLGGLDMALHPQAFPPPVAEPVHIPQPVRDAVMPPQNPTVVGAGLKPAPTETLITPAEDEAHLSEIPTQEIEQAPAAVTTEEFERTVQAEGAALQLQREAQESPVVRTMRVDSAKVDVLLNQVGELVVNRSYVEQLAVELKTFQRTLATMSEVGKKEIQTIKDLTLKVGEASISLGRVATDIQEGVMKLRMLPVGQLFNRMPRLIRDLSRRVGKNVELNVHGGDTEVDKRVIEQIYNPLVHLIRNAVDHGIEDKATRKELGKREEGSVTLSAYSQGNQVVIDVEDDGSGIDTQAVIEKGVESKLIDPQDAMGVSSQDAFNLLFVPGFSTSKKVTRTSGRGVGMDVVKKDVEKINGHVEIESRENQGTRISIKIPLTLAIIQTLLIRSSSHVFAIPLTAVREIIQVAPHEITTIEGFEVIKFRDETIPVLRINEIFKLKHPVEPRNLKFLVLASAGPKSVGFLVEELIGEQDVVIKPLADHVFKSRGLAGSTILGDGTIALVLDVMEAIEDVIARQRQLAQQHAGARYAKTERQVTQYSSTMDL